MGIITKARGKNLSSPVKVPLYAGSVATVDWDALISQEPVNVSKVVNNAKGVRSTLDMGAILTDIEGCRVGMLSKEGNTIYRDIVTLIGMTNTGIIVKFDDEETIYTVAKSQVRFVNGVE